MLQNITIYTKVGCSFCDKAKALLESIGATYTETSFDPSHKTYDKRVAVLIAQTGHRTFPQIYADQEFIGGFEELKKFVDRPSFLTYKVIKRNGCAENVSLDKVVRRINFLANYPTILKGINAVDLAQSIIPSIYDGILTQEIDDIITHGASNRGVEEPDYLIFAARLAVNNLHKKTLTSFKDKMEVLYRNVDKHGVAFPLIDKRFYEFVARNQKEIEQVIDYKRDYLLDYFGIRTMEKGYLQKAGGRIVERPQDAWMRVAIFLHYKVRRTKTVAEKLRYIFESYEMISMKLLTHASPTIFNAGISRPGCISCFLFDTDDSTEAIMNTARHCALASKSCGGIGFSVSKWRSKDSVIRGSNGKTLGIVPFMQMMEKTANAFNQSSKRKGSIAIYLDTHHPDLISFLRTKLNVDNEQEFCKDISIALWVSDLFMKRVKARQTWSFFNPQYHPELLECYGEEYERIYCELEEKGAFESQMPARDIWKEIALAQGSSGMPYILFKDQINRTSNQKNIGIIRTSNLCSEIVEVCDYRDSEANKAEFACCTLASIALPEFVVLETSPERKAYFDYEKLEKVVKVVVRNLNNVIDDTYYPVKETERSNKRHRPLGIGVQGLADVFSKYRVAFDSAEAARLNAEIFEHLYYYALKASNELAREIYETARRTIEETGEVTIEKRKYDSVDLLPTTIGSYSTFEGSPLSQGILNFDYYPEPEHGFSIARELWDALRAEVRKYGVRNSQLIALMPTASTSNILGNTEGFEPYTDNVYVRTTLAGEFIVIVKFLIEELKELGLWTPDIARKIKGARGSIAAIEEIPADIRARFKTVWEISQKAIINLAADRQRFICQSQSMNLHFSQLSLSKFTTAMFMAWEKGLKTGVYYMRTQGASNPDTQVITGYTASPDCCSA